MGGGVGGGAEDGGDFSIKIMLVLHVVMKV